LKNVKIIFSRQGDPKRLPTTSTRSNRLFLPEYNNADQLKTKVLQAIHCGSPALALLRKTTQIEPYL